MFQLILEGRTRLIVLFLEENYIPKYSLSNHFNVGFNVVQTIRHPLLNLGLLERSSTQKIYSSGLTRQIFAYGYSILNDPLLCLQ